MNDDEHLLFITGRLAEKSLRRVVESLSKRVGFTYSIDVLPITVAALMTGDWIARHIQVPAQATRVLLPGYCDGDLQTLRQHVPLPVDIGPRDLHALPEFFGQTLDTREGYGRHTIEIIAEINHAPRLELADILAAARELARDGADIIDVGCEPGQSWNGVADCVKALRDEGHRVSIDSFNRQEIAAATTAGAELVLSVNRTNRDAAADWGCEVVAIPDSIHDLGGLEQTVALLQQNQVALRIDPILEPIGCGFAASLARYMKIRQDNQQVPMMMGIGNLTELTGVDSAGMNVMLLAICEELGIGSVLTTQVINWARSSVRECSLARQLVHFAVAHATVPKHLTEELVMLRDPKIYEQGPEQLQAMAGQIKDANYRVFAEGGEIHLINASVHLHGKDPYQLFAQLMEQHPRNIDASHAFYLGYELAKAVTALTVGKQYRQDEALNWGFLTVPEKTHRSTRPKRASPSP